MKRIHADPVRSAVVVLVGSLAAAGPVAADTPEPVGVAVSAPVAAATVDPSPAAAAPRARDHLLELVAEYLEAAFARDADNARTAQLEPQPVTIVQ